MNYLGEIAALFTSLCYSISAVILTQASRQIGALNTNRVRLIIALSYLAVINLVLFGRPLPIDAGLDRWAWLAVSGIIGLVLGDLFLFHAYALIGPRLGMLLMSLAPAISALAAWLMFGEALRPAQLAGMIVTLIGVGWVVAARPKTDAARPKTDAARPKIDAARPKIDAARPKIDAAQPDDDPPTTRLPVRGLLFGLLAATGQGLGLVLARPGMRGDFSPFAGNAIRMSSAALVLWLITFVQRQAAPAVQSLRNQRSTLRLLMLGALFGPVLGVSSSLLAIQHTAIGVAGTLTALPPVFLLPIGYFAYQERFGWQTVIGTGVALIGVGLLFLA